MTAIANKSKNSAAPAKVLGDIASFSVCELRKNVSKILDQVKAGVTVEITKYGVPVARISPIGSALLSECIEYVKIRPAKNPNWSPHPGRVKLAGSKTSTEVLMEMRAQERY